ncbi:hypothetical protein [EBPR podovirus 3]|nr:hypothetical protein [EBPR podovirus 3]
MLEQILPEHEVIPAEQEHLLALLTDPVLRKYLKGLAIECSKDLLELPILSETPESVHKKHLLVSGQLLVISTLLSIQKD